MTAPHKLSGLIALALMLALAISGCRDPYSQTARQPAQTTSNPPTTPADHVRPGPSAAPPPAAPQRPARSAGLAARAFATRWSNWDWRNAARQQRTLVRLAVGELARQLRANAESARSDATLARDTPGSRGTVAAIQLSRRGSLAAGIVVTREQTYTDGRADLGGQRYRVYRIRLNRDQNRWGVSTWEPQP
jgi:hypothetical protein